MFRKTSFRSALRRSSCFIFVFGILPSTFYRFTVAEPEPKSLIAGQKAFARKDFREALQHFRRAANESPDSIGAQRWLAYMAAVMGEGEEALRAYQNVATLVPSAESSYRLGWFAGEIGETAIAVEALQKSLSHSSREREDIAAFMPAQPREVAQHLFRVFLETPDRNRALFFARSQGWVQEGVDFCKRPASLGISRQTAGLLAVLIHPKHADCALRVGKDLTENGDYRLARFVLIDLVQNSENREIREKAKAFMRHRLPDHDIAKRTEWLNGVATTLKRRFQLPDRALEVFRKAIASDPDFAQPYYRIGYIYWEKKNNDEAVSWLRKALSVQPTHWRATYTLGCVLSDQKRPDEALIYFQKAIELDPEDADGFYRVGAVLSQLEKYEQALSAYQKAIALNPKDAYSHWGVSWVLHKLGREDEAKRIWARALELDPKLKEESRR